MWCVWKQAPGAKQGLVIVNCYRYIKHVTRSWDPHLQTEPPVIDMKVGISTVQRNKYIYRRYMCICAIYFDSLGGDCPGGGGPELRGCEARLPSSPLLIHLRYADAGLPHSLKLELQMINRRCCTIMEKAPTSL